MSVRVRWGMVPVTLSAVLLLAPGLASAAGLAEQAIVHMREAEGGIDRALKHLDGVDHEVDLRSLRSARPTVSSIRQVSKMAA